MSGAPTTCSCLVSRSPSPIPQRTLRWRSRAAGLASGSPPSSPSFSFSGLAHPLNWRDGSTSPLQSQVASNQGASGSQSRGQGVETREPVSSPTADTALMDVDTEAPTTMDRDLAKAIKALTAQLGGQTCDCAAMRCDELKASIDTATSDGAVISLLAKDYQSNLWEFFNSYRSEVEALANAHSSLEKLHKHEASKTFLASINSIKCPSIQFSHGFSMGPIKQTLRRSYPASGTEAQPPATRNLLFHSWLDHQVNWLKTQILTNLVVEKRDEVTYLETKASAVQAITRFEEAVDKRHESLKARYDYLIRQPRYLELVADVNFQGAIIHSLASCIITKINSLVLTEEDRKLAAALKKMELDKPAVEAAAQAPDNKSYDNMMKVIERLEKKVDLQSKKVRDHLLTLMRMCAGQLSLTLPLLENLVVDLVAAGREEVEGAEEEGEERQVRHNWKEKSRQGQGCSKGRQNRQKRQVGRRVLDETKVEGQQEEEWQKVGRSFELDFSRTDCGLVSGLGRYEFSDLYRLDWALLTGSCRFLCMASPPSILLNPCLL